MRLGLANCRWLLTVKQYHKQQRKYAESNLTPSPQNSLLLRLHLIKIMLFSSMAKYIIFEIPERIYSFSCWLEQSHNHKSGVSKIWAVSGTSLLHLVVKSMDLFHFEFSLM